MKQIKQWSHPSVRRSSVAAGAALALALLAGAVHAQDDAAIEELEQQLEEQRIALEEAIINREQTAAQVDELQVELDESEQRRVEMEEEFKALCEEQEALKAGTFDECMSSIDS